MSGSSSADWWQLLRAGNVFTAISNIFAGYLLARGEWQPILPLLFLVLCSAMLYLAGMVLNDVFDLEEDRQQRPERPLPSGRIDPGTARIIGWALVIDGLSAAGVASWLLNSWWPIAVASLLTVAIVAYDAWLKNTSLGPYSMGTCRTLNILLGASAAFDSANLWPAILYAVAIGVYTVGLTRLAQDEDQQSQHQQVQTAGMITQVGTFLILLLPLTLSVPRFGWFAMWFVCWMIVRIYLLHSVDRGDPRSVRKSVSGLITSFISLDALACVAAVGWLSGLPVLALLLPTYVATRRISMT